MAREQCRSEDYVMVLMMMIMKEEDNDANDDDDVRGPHTRTEARCGV